MTTDTTDTTEIDSDINAHADTDTKAQINNLKVNPRIVSPNIHTLNDNTKTTNNVRSALWWASAEFPPYLDQNSEGTPPSTSDSVERPQWAASATSVHGVVTPHT